MLTLLISSFLVQSPYAFEIDRGFVIEPVVGMTVVDKEDRTGYSSGLRLSWLNPDQTDAVFTGELQALYQVVPTGKTYSTPRHRLWVDGLLAFYEFYHPWALRVLGGPSVEFRETSGKSFGLAYRIGGGYYFSSGFGVFMDFGGRAILRKSNTSMPYDLSASAQFIF